MTSSGKWTADVMPDLGGRVAVVTGSNTGIGFEAAKVLAGKNATVVLAVRDIVKGGQAASRIEEAYKDAKLSVMELDLASLKSVRAFSQEFKRAFQRLDLLINNAGLMVPPYSKTEDGFELQFGINHLGHFALTAQLHETIMKTDNSRIVNVSSGAHRQGRLDFDDLNWERRAYNRIRAYGDSKLANLYFTYELDRRLRESGGKTISVAAHPGWTATELQRHIGALVLLNKIFAQKPEMGALPTLRACLDSGASGGDYFGPGGFMEMRGYPVKVQSNRLSHDMDNALKLWEKSEEMTGVKYGVST